MVSKVSSPIPIIRPNILNVRHPRPSCSFNPVSFLLWTHSHSCICSYERYNNILHIIIYILHIIICAPAIYSGCIRPWYGRMAIASIWPCDHTKSKCNYGYVSIIGKILGWVWTHGHSEYLAMRPYQEQMQLWLCVHNRKDTGLACALVSYPTLSAGRHFIRRLPGSGKDCTQNRCTVCV